MLGVAIPLPLGNAGIAQETRPAPATTPEAKPVEPAAKPVETPPTPPVSPVSPPAAPRSVEEAAPVLYYLRDKDGNLQPVPGFRLEDFEEMVRQKHRTDRPEPLPPFVLQEIQVEGTARGAWADLKIQCRILTQLDDWVRVPLRLDQAVLRGAPQYKGPGNQFLCYRGDSGYVAWIRGTPGQEHTLVLEAAVPLTVAGNEQRVRLYMPRAGKSEWKLTTPMPNAEARASEGTVVQPPVKADGGTTLGFSGPTGDFEIAWRPAAEWNAQKQANLDSTGIVMARVDGQGITFDARLTVRSLGGPFDHCVVRLPKESRLVGGNSPRYSLTPVARGGPAGEDWRLVEVQFPKKTAGPEEVQLVARLEFDATGAANWCELAGFEVVGADRQSGYLGVYARSEWQVLLDPRRGVRQIDELPPAFRPAEPPRADEPSLIAAFEYAGQPASLAARVVPRSTRITVDPEYVFRVESNRVTLNARLKCNIRSAKVRTIDVELGDWQDPKVGPESLVSTGAAAVDKSGLLSVPLKQESMGRIELTIEASRSLAPGAKDLRLEVPRVRSDAHAATTIAQAPASVVVLTAADVELAPMATQMIGLTRQAPPPTAVAESPAQDLLFFQADPVKAVFAASFSVRERSVRVAAQSEIVVDDQKTQVAQTLRYRVAYRPIRWLALEVPRTIALNEQLEATGDGGKPLALGDIAEREEPGEDVPTIRRYVLLPDERLGTFEIKLRYPVVLEKLTPQASVAAAVPLVMPADGELISNRVTVVGREGVRVRCRGGGWNVVETQAPASRQAVELTSASRTHEVPLAVQLDETGNVGPTVVRRAWIQTWLAGPVRQDRAVFLFSSDEKAIELFLPSGADPSSLRLTFDGKSIGPQTVGERLFVPLPDASEGEHRLIADYRFQAERPGPGLLTIELPRLGRGGGMSRTYWQLELPAKEHIVDGPAGLNPEYVWGWTGVFWGRLPLAEPAQLEAWSGGENLPEPAQRANRYLFSATGPPGPCELRTARRPMIVLAASALALIAGLLLLYVRWLRHPAALLALAAVLGWTAVVYPAATLLTAQAASLGVLLATVAAVLQRTIGRPHVPKDASSVLERGSTQARRRLVVPGGLETTDAAPAMAPLSAPGSHP